MRPQEIIHKKLMRPLADCKLDFRQGQGRGKNHVKNNQDWLTFSFGGFGVL